MPSRDYEEFIAALNSHRARYLVVGAHAVAHHARPRATKDLDILFEPTRQNARLLLAALGDFFGGTDLGYREEDLDTRVLRRVKAGPGRAANDSGPPRRPRRQRRP